MDRRSRTRGLVVLIGALALVISAAPAGAGVAEHCVADVVQQSADGELALSELRCYSTFAGALADATAGTMLVSPSTPGSAVFTNEAIGVAAATFTLGIHFDGYNGTGSSVTVVGSNCNGGWWNTSSYWSNRISSSYNGCMRLRHYDWANKGGMFADTYGSGTTDNLPYLMNNKTNSVAYLGA